MVLAATVHGQTTVPTPQAPPTLSFAPVVQKVLPSVVSVSTARTVRMPPALRQFFGTDPSEKIQGLGSGVIVSADGYILTNNHVIKDADEIVVNVGAERKEYRAKRIGTDPGSDLAVLKIEGKDLSAASFADSEQIRVGDVVLAVGTPFGLDQTVTMGIVSGLGRGGMGIVDYENFIQTDASINPGNSGGALVDTSGRIVGINTAIFSRTGGNMGIGFAVPSNLAQQVLQSIREKGRVIRGYLGTLVQPLTDDLARALKLTKQTGALVAEVSARSPAEQAGLRSGDVIIAINNKPIQDPRQLRLLVGAMTPGAPVEIKFIRDGQEKISKALLAELPPTQPKTDEDSPSDAPNILKGVKIGDLNEETKRTLKVSPEIQGAVIVGVEEDSTAYKAGLREGQIIQEINRQPVRTAADAIRLGQASTEGSLLLRVWAEGTSQYVVVERQ